MLIRQMQIVSGRSLARTLTLAGALALSGCQEDSRASKTNSDQAASIAGERLDQAMGSFRETLGQPSKSAGQQAGVPTLKWSAPLTREDGSPLYADQISGYRIYYRLKHKKQFSIIPVESPAQSRFSLHTLPPGAYEFSITTIDDNGRESRRSAPVSVNLVETRQG